VCRGSPCREQPSAPRFVVFVVGCPETLADDLLASAPWYQDVVGTRVAFTFSGKCKARSTVGVSDVRVKNAFR